MAVIVDYNFIKCEIHKKDIVEFIQELTSTFFICNWCKNTNKILKGLRIDYDENDFVQKTAYQYSIKKKK